MRYLLAITILVAMGAFFGFDELWRVIWGKSSIMPTCRDQDIREMLVQHYVRQLMIENPQLNMRDAEVLRNGTRIRFSNFEEKDESEKENRIYCKADFSAKNDSMALYFQSSGSVEYDIHLVSKEKIESILKMAQRTGRLNIGEMLIENIYIKWDTENFKHN